MTLSDSEDFGDDCEAKNEESGGLFQFRDFLLLDSIRYGADGQQTCLAGKGRTLRQPFALLAAAEFHRITVDDTDYSNDIHTRWKHRLVELSFGKPSLKEFRYEVSSCGIRLDCSKPTYLGPRNT